MTNIDVPTPALTPPPSMARERTSSPLVDGRGIIGHKVAFKFLKDSDG